MRTICGWLFLISIMLAAVFGLHVDLRSHIEEELYPYRSFFLPDSEYMKVASLGYRNFWADMLFLWQIQYYDYYRKENRYDYLERTFHVITDLDPKHQEPYVMGALFAFLGERWDLVYMMADKGLENIPDNHFIAYDAGMYALVSEKNYPRAVHYFRIAEERNPDDTFLKIIMGKALRIQGSLEQSMAYWQELYERVKDKNDQQSNLYRGSALRNMWLTRIKIDQRDVGIAVAEWRKRHEGTSPPSLDALVWEGLLPGAPLDPAGEPYLYDPDEGTIRSESPFDFKSAVGSW